MKRMSVEEKAAEWFVQLQSAHRIEDKWQEFEKWIEESGKHEAAFTQIESAWALADRLRDSPKPDLISLGIEADNYGVPRTYSFSRWIREQKWSLLWIAIFAGCILSVMRHLYTNTTVRVSIDSRERHLAPDRVEELFDVVQGPVRPFSILTGRSRVVYVLGDTSHLVGPQHSATITARGIEVEKLTPGEGERRTAWTRSELQFAGETLDEAVMQFNRYNEKQLQIVDPAIRHRPVGGTFLARDPEGFADFIEKSLEVRHFMEFSEDGTPIIALAGKGTP